LSDDEGILGNGSEPKADENVVEEASEKEHEG